jgi:pyruvate/2-oxoglutarate dehydrogenase complex dihydrolipoamide dehydrogenase (E3) component
MDYVEERQNMIREHENKEFLEKEGLEVVIGKARFIGPQQVAVNGNAYTARKIVIATGSRPRELKIPDVDQVQVYNNERIWDLRRLPGRLLVIGGGPNGVELAQAMQRLGSRVSVVSRGKQILEHEGPAIAGVLYQCLQQEGINFYMGYEPESFPTATTLRIKSTGGEALELSFDAIYTGIGRELDFKELDPEKAGIATDQHGKVILNDYLQSTNKNVFVSGDAAGSLMFSHGAELHTRLLVNNFFSPVKKKLSYQHFSWVTFTDPEVAHFGLDEQQLKEKGIRYEHWETDFALDDRAVIGDYRDSRMILFVERNRLPGRKHKVLGGAMVAPGAGEICQELILANKMKLGVEDLFNKVYPYPVASRISQLLIAEHYEKDKLTSLAKKALKLAFRMKW